MKKPTYPIGGNYKQRSSHKALVCRFFVILFLLFNIFGVIPTATTQSLPLIGETTAPIASTEPTAANSPDGLDANDLSTMQDLIRQAQYQFAWQVSEGEWAYHAPNRANDLSLSLATDGFHAVRYNSAGEPLWDFSLALAAYGEQTFPAFIAEVDLVGDRERVEYHWNQDVVEWYTNSAEGVEHGLTLTAPPTGADGSSVELTFALRSSLTPELDANEKTLRLKDASDQTVLLYDQLAVYDATGRSLPAYFSLPHGGDRADEGGWGEGRRLLITIDTANAIFPLTVDPILHDQIAKLTASDPEIQDKFGWSVAVSGDTVIVGAPYEDGGAGGTDRGAAYIFERNKLGTDYWGEVRKLQIIDPENEAQFGYSVAISGDTAIVGAPRKDNVGGIGCVTGTDCGAVYVFERNQGGADNWGMVVRKNGLNTGDYDRFGYSVAISNDTVVVGAPYAGPGDAYVFERNWGGADHWGQVKNLAVLSTVPYDFFGSSVGISGDTIVVGAMGTDVGGTERGRAYVFSRNLAGADEWGWVTSMAAFGSGDQFGYSVAISDDTIVVGAKKDDSGSTDGGAVYIFKRNQGGPADNWGQVTKLLASDPEATDHFGESVAISNDTIIVGASYEDGTGTGRGASYVFERNWGGVDSWGQVTKLTASDTQDYDYFGNSVAISGDTLVVGAPSEDGENPTSNQGAAYVFVNSDGQWRQIADPRADDAEGDDRFGIAVAISGDTAIVGADGEDGGSDDMGAAYILERNQDGTDSWGQVKKLFGWDSTNYDWFGISVDISGDTAVVGAYGESGAGNLSGAAYVFERNKGLSADYWGQVAKLTASDAGDGDRFGYSVAISTDTIVVGAPWEEGNVGYDRGSVYIFTRNADGADNWGQVAKLTSSSELSYAYFGYSVDISGDTVVVGAYRDGSSETQRGAAYVFQRNQGGPADNWGQVKKLIASDAANNDHFGISVTISGATIVVGANQEDGWMMDNRGAAYVFERNQGGTADNWGQVTKLLATDMVAGDEFGKSVAISGDTVIVGADMEDAGAFLPNRGAAYIFERNEGGRDNWGHVTKLTASGAGTNNYFGHSVSISDDTVIVGAYGKRGGLLSPNQGAAYVFSLQPIYRIYLPLVINSE